MQIDRYIAVFWSQDKGFSAQVVESKDAAVWCVDDGEFVGGQTVSLDLPDAYTPADELFIF